MAKSKGKSKGAIGSGNRDHTKLKRLAQESAHKPIKPNGGKKRP